MVGRLPERSAAALFAFDAGYDPVRLQRGLEGCRAQVLVRLHSGRTFYSDPERLAKRPVGRPFRHGSKFACKDAATWPEPPAGHRAEDAGYGSVRVRAWSGLHPKTRRGAERYGSESAAVVEGTAVLVEVERLPSVLATVGWTDGDLVSEVYTKYGKCPGRDRPTPRSFAARRSGW